MEEDLTPEQKPATGELLTNLGTFTVLRRANGKFIVKAEKPEYLHAAYQKTDKSVSFEGFVKDVLSQAFTL